MSIRRLFSFFGSNLRHSSSPRGPQKPRHHALRPRLETLEDRRMLSISPLECALFQVNDLETPGADAVGVAQIVAPTVPQTAPQIALQDESAVLPTVSLSDFLLTISGTDSDDWVEVEETGAEIIIHMYDPAGQTRLASRTFIKADVSQIAFFGHGGDDTFKNWSRDAGACTLDCTAYGGDGNDYLQGGAGQNFLDGGNGDNIIIGGRGVNIFVNEGYGSSAFIWCGTDDRWAAGSSAVSAGNDDAHLYFYTTDRQGGTGYSYAGTPYTYRAWADAEILTVVDTLSYVHDVFGNYRFATAGQYADKAVYFCIFSAATSFTGLCVSDRGIHFRDLPTQTTVIHELAHLWNYSSPGTSSGNYNPYFADFSNISWLASSQLRSGAAADDFAPHYNSAYTLCVYGTSNVLEDWATTVAYVLTGQFPPTPSAKWDAKVELVWDFVAYVNADREARSVIVTTDLDVIDANDGLISLREAVLYASENVGTTITFAENMRGKTIFLEAGAINIHKNITVDAAGMDITLDASRVVPPTGSADRGSLLNTNADHVALIGLALTGATGGYAIESRGGLTFSDSKIFANDNTSATILHWTYNVLVSAGTWRHYARELRFDDCDISHNTTGDYGIIMITIADGSTVSENLTITDSLISNNTAGKNGIIRLNHAGEVVIANTLILDNESSQWGAIYASAAASVRVVNSVVAGNNKAALALFNTDGVLTNTTIAVNGRDVGTSGSVYLSGEGKTLAVNNSILARNDSAYDLVTVNGASAEIHHSLLGVIYSASVYQADAASVVGTYSQPADPQFAAVTPQGTWLQQDLRLQETSPARGTASTVLATGITADILGNRRISGGTVDMGAYQTVVDEPTPVSPITPVVCTQYSGIFATQIPTSAEAIHEWQPFYLELWTVGGEFQQQVTVTYDANLFQLRQTSSSNVILTQGESHEDESTGMTTFTITMKPRATYVEPADGEANLLAVFYFTPATKGVSADKPGVAASDIYRDAGTQSWLRVNDTNLATDVWAVPYDLNDDGKINIYDLIQFAKAYGQSTATNPVPDFNGDGKINIYDLILFAKQYGATRESAANVTVPQMIAALNEALQAALPAMEELPPEIAAMFGFSPTIETPVLETPAKYNAADYHTGLLYWVPEKNETAAFSQNAFTTSEAIHATQPLWTPAPVKTSPAPQVSAEDVSWADFPASASAVSAAVLESVTAVQPAATPEVFDCVFAEEPPLSDSPVNAIFTASDVFRRNPE